MELPITYRAPLRKSYATVAAQLIKQAGGHRIWCFSGDLGAGKTTLIQALCAHLGTKALITSPSFSLVNEYYLAPTQAIYHFDYYRMTHIEEAVHIGFESYLAGDAYVFIEWPQLILPLLPATYFEVAMAIEKFPTRLITARIINPSPDARRHLGG